ncbi:MAG: uracil-DNA glycosylase [Hyphomicrobiaceae bacterium]
MKPTVTACEPGHDCPLCPRLVAFRADARVANPTWHNAPVASFGASAARILLVGLAPGLKGANRTGRPFTGDFAGDLLYTTLLELGLAKGSYGATPDDGLELVDCRITNAVRCVPPANKPTTAEIATCRVFLAATIATMPRLKVVVALGRIAHESVLASLDFRRATYPFGHGRVHHLRPDLTLHDSYHCSRYNTNTGVLTPAMFRSVLQNAKASARNA